MKTDLLKKTRKQKYEAFIVQHTSTVIEVMKKIDLNAHGIAYVCNGETLLGTVSDGDIRRFIINNGDLNTPVYKITKEDYKYVTQNSESEATCIMRENRISSVPLVNENKEIIKIFFLQTNSGKEKEQIKRPVVIMAGGIGSRLKPYTNILPKPLIPFGDKTITEHIMDRFLQYGCKHFDMILNYKHHFIQSYFADIDHPYDISFHIEDEFLGTGGGLYLLRDKYDEPFFLTNCDILVEDDYADISSFHYEQKNLVTMVCAVKNIRLPYGTIDLEEDGGVKRINEKPELSFMTNTGFYVISPDFIKWIPEKRNTQITDVIQTCINAGEKVGIYPIPEDAWYDMGQFEELERLKHHLSLDT